MCNHIKKIKILMKGENSLNLINDEEVKHIIHQASLGQTLITSGNASSKLGVPLTGIVNVVICDQVICITNTLTQYAENLLHGIDIAKRYTDEVYVLDVNKTLNTKDTEFDSIIFIYESKDYDKYCNYLLELENKWMFKNFDTVCLQDTEIVIVKYSKKG
jgi:hypothetical protein